MAITARNAEPDAPFTLASLIGPAGTGANGERLVESLKFHYPPELRAAMLKRHNRALTDSLTAEQIAKVAKIAGAQPGADLNVKVHGGHTRADDAWATYAYHDADGRLWKGAFLLSELDLDDPPSHVNQRESLSAAPAAADYDRVRAKVAASQPNAQEVQALQARIADLERELGAAPAESAEEVAALREQLEQAQRRAAEAEQKLAETAKPKPAAKSKPAAK